MTAEERIILLKTLSEMTTPEDQRFTRDDIQFLAENGELELARTLSEAYNKRFYKVVGRDLFAASVRRRASEHNR